MSAIPCFFFFFLPYYLHCIRPLANVNFHLLFLLFSLFENIEEKKLGSEILNFIRNGLASIFDAAFQCERDDSNGRLN